MKKTGAEIIIQMIEEAGITHIAGIPGGANLPLYDALSRSSIQHILARHEQGAGFIAHGMARSTGKPAVCFGTSGPGATNLITAIADAKSDSVPLIAITGQVPTGLIGTDAFQEVDMIGMCLPITKHCYFAEKAEDLLHIMPEAFRLASEGRPGPIVIDVPKDVQKEIIEFENWPAMNWPESFYPVSRTDIDRMAEMINSSQKPVLYIGGGIVQSNSSYLIRELSNRSNIPIVSTLMGLGCIPCDDPLYLGMLGMHGARSTNVILQESDCLIALGVRFDDRATGKVAEFCPNASIIHVDIDARELGKIKNPSLGIRANVKDVLQKICPYIEFQDRTDWINTMDQLKKDFSDEDIGRNNPSHPNHIIEAISHCARNDSIITTDVGQHQMWTAQKFPFQFPRSFLTSGGLGTMGFGLPAAIGAAIAHPDRQIICISGDGSILMNIQELDVLAELGLNVKIIILNNEQLGLVRQQQELFFKENYMASIYQQKANFNQIARGFGLFEMRTSSQERYQLILETFLNQPGPGLLNFYINDGENVFPMVPPGAANCESIKTK